MLGTVVGGGSALAPRSQQGPRFVPYRNTLTETRTTMARPDKIRTGHLEPRVRELVRAGKTSREIADALTADGHPIGHVAVARFLKAETEDRREAAKSVAAAEAQATVPKCTEDLRAFIDLAKRHAETTDDDSARARLITAGIAGVAKLHAITVGEDGPRGGGDIMGELSEILEQRRRRA